VAIQTRALRLRMDLFARKKCVSQDPLTLSLSPRGEGTPYQRLRPDSLSPWGEGWGEGVFAV